MQNPTSADVSLHEGSSGLPDASGDGQEYADKRGVRSWMLMDWAMQPFHTVILTFIIGPYFASAVAPDPVTGQQYWGYAVGIGGLIIALLSPVLGAVADATGPRKPWIFGFACLAVIGSFLLWFMLPAASPTIIFWSLVAFVIAMIGFEFGAVFINAMMPDLVPRSQMGRLSGSSWGLGYLGGLVTLIVILCFLAVSGDGGKTLIGLDPILGLDPEQREGTRAAGPMTALWFMVFAIPFFLYTPDTRKGLPVANAVQAGISDLWMTIKRLFTKGGSLFTYLMSSMFYRDALNGLYTFGGVYAVGVLGWSIIQIGIFGLLANITGALGAWLGGILDDRMGPKFVVTGSIILLVIASLSIISTGPGEVFFISVGPDSSLPDIMFYVFGGLIGAAGGALQASSRVLLVDQAEDGRMTEAFGLYALSGRATSFLAPLLIAWATGVFDSQRVGVLPVVALFLIGLVMLIWVKARNPHQA